MKPLLQIEVRKARIGYPSVEHEEKWTIYAEDSIIEVLRMLSEILAKTLKEKPHD